MLHQSGIEEEVPPIEGMIGTALTEKIPKEGNLVSVLLNLKLKVWSIIENNDIESRGEERNHLESVRQKTAILVCLLQENIEKFPEWNDQLTDDRFLIELVECSALHDIGKSRVPIEILNKKEPLTQSDWEEILLHVKHGSDILRGENLPTVATDINDSHHWWWNGQLHGGVQDGRLIRGGYPNQGEKKEDEIPMAGQLVSIIDVIDALEAQRPYKESWTRESIIAKLENSLRGTQFKPSLVDLIVENYDRFSTQESPEVLTVV